MKKICVPLLCVVLFLMASLLTMPPSPLLVPYYDEQIKLYGYCTADGKEVIPPRFSYAELFSDNGLACVIDENESGTGFIDKSGKYIIPPKFGMNGSGREWSCGLLPVWDRDTEKYGYYGGYGYLNERGRYVIKPKYAYVSPFSDNGLALVRTGPSRSGKWEYINKYGKSVITPECHDAMPFSNGLAAIRTGDAVSGKWGFIDEHGTMVIKPQFDCVYPFTDDGLARVLIGDFETGKWGFIDKTGSFAIEPKFSEVWDFSSNGLACFRYGDAFSGKWGFINRHGNIVIEPQFDYADSFSENGLAYVRNNDETSGFIDATGRYITDPQILYPKLYAKSGPICVPTENGYKYLNEKGEELFLLDMPYAESFNEYGIAKAGYCWYDCHVGETHNPIYHYINLRGEIIRPK